MCKKCDEYRKSDTTTKGKRCKQKTDSHYVFVNNCPEQNPHTEQCHSPNNEIFYAWNNKVNHNKHNQSNCNKNNCNKNNCNKCYCNKCYCNKNNCNKCYCNKSYCTKCNCNKSNCSHIVNTNDECECDRDYLCNSETLRIKLAKLNGSGVRSKCKSQKNPNAEEIKYDDRNYNGSFHKALQHSNNNGRLTNASDYESMVCSILKNDQKTLNEMSLATGAEFKLTDPLVSLSGVLVGSDFCSCVNMLAEPPALSSKAMAAEMIELYGMKLTRDVWFGDFSTDSIVSDVINYLNPVKSYLPDLVPANTIDTSNIFRGNIAGDLVGPYISQLLLLNTPQGGLTTEQKYLTPPNISTAQMNGYTVEWGRNNVEMVKIQNTQISTLPPGPPSTDIIPRYINNGRALAEAVHIDPAFHIGYCAGLILQSLGAKLNPGIPVLPTHSGFSAHGGAPSFQCAIAEVSGLALKHAWFWKWQVYRKLRPEVTSLWVDNVKNNRVPNAQNYDLDSLLLNSAILPDIKTANATWGTGFENSYTLAQCFKEGSPTHPAYPSGHAVIAGACATIIKIFLDCEKKWSSLPGVATPNRRVIPTTVTTGVAMSNADGSSLVNYTGSDASNIYIYGEVDKLASNIAIGRNWAGVHYRTDATKGIKLGEMVAISYIEDIMSTWVTNNLDGTSPKITFRRFDGTLYTVEPKICK